MIFNTFIHIKYYIFIIIIYSVTSTIYPNKYKSKTEYVNIRHIRNGPQTESVFERGLIEKEPLVKDIINENGGYYENTTYKNFNGIIMSYVTPELLGFDVSITWAKKFNIISLVSLQIKRVGLNSYSCYGIKAFNKNWLKNLRKSGESNDKTIEVYPRLELYKLTEFDYTKLFTHHSERRALNKLIIDVCSDNNLNGIVLEVWHELADKVYINHLYKFIADLADDLKAEGFKLILTIPAWQPVTGFLFTTENFEHLYSYVEYFALKTYDYSPFKTPGPNAPLPWMRAAVENIVPLTEANYKLKRKKILMGLNLYGNDFTSDNKVLINGEQYINLLKNYKHRLKFDEVNIENVFIVSKSNGRHVVFYPTIYTINERIKLAEELGVGLALIELSLGLNYFYDLF